MATEMTPRQRAEQRLEAGGKQFKSFKDAGAGAVRALELNNINEGETVAIPVDYKVYQQPIAGSTNLATVTITEEGKSFYISALTRSAQPAAGGDRIFPSGSVVEKCQEYGSMDEFFKNELAGKKITFTKKTPVITEFNGETRTVNVWQIDFAK